MNATRRFKIIAGIYGGLWILSVASFWLVYKDSQMAMLHILVSGYAVLPLLTFILSLLLGMEHIPAKYIWLVPISFSVAYLLQSLLTHSLGQYVLLGGAAFPGIAYFVAVVVVSTAGLLIGIAVKALRMKLKKCP